ncbi:MAG: dipeptidase PepV [Lactobacillaceae bacterium]|jgi:dipeptidase D|nr:dipeptidase PepV [Lactobacillaceae bacterium]
MTPDLQQQFLDDLKYLISIPSFIDASTADIQNPFGKNISYGLDFFRELATRDGFVYGNIENRVAWIEYGNSKATPENTVAILGHVDVVPAGDGWTKNPFKAEVIDDKIYGRGSMDMKGDLMANYYALRLIKEQNIPLNPEAKIRLIIGGNEEGAWDDLPHYFKQEGTPTIGYSPDGKFPVGIGEKGYVTFRFNTPKIEQFGLTQLISFEGGVADNMVPDSATAIIETPYTQVLAKDFQSFLARRSNVSGDFEIQTNLIKLTLNGITAHGAYPQLGVNAVTTLAHFLTRVDFDPYVKAFLQVIGNFLHNDPYAKKLGLDYTDQEMGPVTENLGQLKFNHEEWKATVNFRIPKGVDISTIETKFNQLFRRIGVEINGITQSGNPHFIPIDDPVVTALSDVYRQHTKSSETTFVASGGSYASLLKRGVAFGGQFPDTPVMSHKADEYAIISDFYKAIDIFKDSIIALSKLI